jgi:hypothetical protein
VFATPTPERTPNLSRISAIAGVNKPYALSLLRPTIKKLGNNETLRPVSDPVNNSLSRFTVNTLKPLDYLNKLSSRKLGQKPASTTVGKRFSLGFSMNNEDWYQKGRKIHTH